MNCYLFYISFRILNIISRINNFIFICYRAFSLKVTNCHPRRSPSKDPAVARSNAAWAQAQVIFLPNN